VLQGQAGIVLLFNQHPVALFESQLPVLAVFSSTNTDLPVFNMAIPIDDGLN